MQNTQYISVLSFPLVKLHVHNNHSMNMYGEKQDLLFNTFTLNFYSLIESNYSPSFLFLQKIWIEYILFEQLLYTPTTLYQSISHVFPRNTKTGDFRPYLQDCLLASFRTLLSTVPSTVEQSVSFGLTVPRQDAQRIQVYKE